MPKHIPVLLRFFGLSGAAPVPGMAEAADGVTFGLSPSSLDASAMGAVVGRSVATSSILRLPSGAMTKENGPRGSIILH